jgi:uncharacterized protein (TIGR02271 family)
MEEQYNLKRYSEVDDVEIADHDPDVRGWQVITTDGREIGEVDDLIVDTAAMKVRYLEVDIDRSTFGLSEDRRVALPAEVVGIDRDNKKVVVSGMSAEHITKLPAYEGGRFDREHTGYTRSDEKWTGEYGGGRRLTRAEEELRIGKRASKTGEVRVGKHVETEHVREPVSRMREEVHVERRPATHDTPSEARIEEGEVRMPVFEEEVVVDKRPVVKEELVVGKEKVEERDTVEADLKKEKFDVDKEGTYPRKDDPTRRGGR